MTAGYQNKRVVLETYRKSIYYLKSLMVIRSFRNSSDLSIRRRAVNINNLNSLGLKRPYNPIAAARNQSVSVSWRLFTSFKRVILFSALGLVIKPYFVYAEENSDTSNLQIVAESYAQEVGNVLAEDHWIRVEFGSTYIDPIVIIEGPSTNINKFYVVGTRNVDKMGFEISLKNCNNAPNTPIQEYISYTVIEKSQLPSTILTNGNISQAFSWGECATVAADITTKEIL
jgi:hypothetical protein